MSSEGKVWSENDMEVLVRYAGLRPTEQELAGLKIAEPQVRRRMLLVREGLRREDEPSSIYALPKPSSGNRRNVR